MLCPTVGQHWEWIGTLSQKGLSVTEFWGQRNQPGCAETDRKGINGNSKSRFPASYDPCLLRGTGDGKNRG